MCILSACKCARGTAVNFVLDEPRIRAVSFVGSDHVGRYIWERGTKNGKRVQSNMGAKNHGVVMPDCNRTATLNSLVSCPLLLPCRLVLFALQLFLLLTTYGLIIPFRFSPLHPPSPTPHFTFFPSPLLFSFNVISLLRWVLHSVPLANAVWPCQWRCLWARQSSGKQISSTWPRV